MESGAGRVRTTTRAVDIHYISFRGRKSTCFLYATLHHHGR
jgi:hypothetical protein